MAYRSSGRCNNSLIDNLTKNKFLSTPRVIDAFRKVDRADFVTSKSVAYDDFAQNIGYGATISAPHMHAVAMEHLNEYLQPGAQVLDVGSGSGYLLPIMANLCPGGKVVGIDHSPSLVEQSAKNLGQHHQDYLDSGTIKVVTGDGRLGYEQEGPYDAIHVGAASPDLNEELIKQLRSPGRMFIPVGTFEQSITVVDKDENGKVSSKKLMDVQYIPLTDREKQEGRRK